MKKILRYLPLLALAVIVSCTTIEEGMDRAEVLQVSTNKMDINALGGDDTFTITSHCDWLTEVSYKGADTKWIELSSTKGSSGTKDVTIVFDENKSVDDRYATITVSNDRYNLSQSIEIHQKAGEPFILLDQREKEVTADGETIVILTTQSHRVNLGHAHRLFRVSRVRIKYLLLLITAQSQSLVVPQLHSRARSMIPLQHLASHKRS